MKSAQSRPLPDPEISLRDARDFIFGSLLGRRALCCPEIDLRLFLHDLLDAIYRLVRSCHLPEFTDHGLPHLCSLVDRISRWELRPDDSGRIHLWQELSPDEAAILLIATLIHDIGMLSQNPINLPDDASHLKSKSLWPDIATWVRKTHVDRLEKLVCRLLRHAEHDAFLDSALYRTAVEVAKSHQSWHWEWEGEWTDTPRYRGLAAVVAVADLLDEDSARCDTTTLLEHREGTQLNRAHWLRHGLTSNRILVVNGRIHVEMVRPPGTEDSLRPVFSALRNHFKLVQLYNSDLSSIGAGIEIDLIPSTGVPILVEPSLAGWREIGGFATENALCYQLLRSFLDLALKNFRGCSPKALEELKKISLEDVDLRLFYVCEGAFEPRTEFERTFTAIAETDL